MFKWALGCVGYSMLSIGCTVLYLKHITIMVEMKVTLHIEEVGDEHSCSMRVKGFMISGVCF